MSTSNSDKRYVVCLSNEGYSASLDARKIYQVVPDADGEAQGLVRVIDESGESYLYPRGRFADIELPQDAEAAFG